MVNVFVSYSRDSSEHIKWVARLAERLRVDGLNVVLDQWHLVPGDQLPFFMEKSVRENDFVLIVCTPNYKRKSDNRIGGVGYEGDIITAEISAYRNSRKFIPILKLGSNTESMPSWLLGSYYIDLREQCSGLEDNYKSLVMTLNKINPIPSIGEFGQTFAKYEECHDDKIDISGCWVDSSDYDTIYFKQVNNKAVGIYNYGHKCKTGALIGAINRNVFEFEWKWFEIGYKGYGRLKLSPNLMSGIWWYENKDRLIEHVGYRYLSKDIPNWLCENDFREFDTFFYG